MGFFKYKELLYGKKIGKFYREDGRNKKKKKGEIGERWI
jgi:hypothetical protein